MANQVLQWQVQPPVQPPEAFVEAVKRHAPTIDGRYAAQLLWQRGIQDVEQLAGYLNPKSYRPANPSEFGREMDWAVERLQRARVFGEIVAIWGDFDADGITATSVLWEGLGEFFPQNQRLFYYIPNRITESHGLNISGIDRLAAAGTQLIVTCDTGSTNLAEIDYALERGIDVIVTDHHTLPKKRPAVTAIINPRYLPNHHPLFHLSGVAVAYKLVEALYAKLPEVPQQPLEDLLDLVAIGLIADLVQLSGDCRYLAQEGIKRLQQQTKTPTRPGVARLLELCQRSGDRPTDISFGIGPRINAVSRIHGDARFCVELLTSRDEQRCHQLATETELANTRRKSLQKEVTQKVKEKLSQLDLSTTSVIVLVDSAWASGVLGLVAGQIAQEYGRPTIILTTEADIDEINPAISEVKIARGSARSVNNIDLYQLVQSQAHLLHRFGGHPFAAGLSLPVENIPVFTEAINQHLRQLSLTSGALMMPSVEADLVIPASELGKDLFQELKLLEPCGMGNPAPKLLIQNCWFERVFNRNIKDSKGNKVQYIKTTFEIADRSSSRRFPGIWWGHYKDEIPTGNCDAIGELDFNTYQARYEFRLIAVRPHVGDSNQAEMTPRLEILDWRDRQAMQQLSLLDPILPVYECPTSWDRLQTWFKRAVQTHHKLAIAYPPPEPTAAEQTWAQLVGIAKYLSRTEETATLTQLAEKLKLSDRTLQLGLQTLTNLGFQVNAAGDQVKIAWNSNAYPSVVDSESSAIVEHFVAAVREEQFLSQYFYAVPVSTIEAMANQTLHYAI